MAKKTKEKKYVPPTLRQYRKYRNIHYGLKSASIPTLVAPFGIELGVNWQTWFQRAEDKVSIAVGLFLALVTTLLSGLAIAKRDSELMKKIGPFYALGVLFCLLGVINLLLAQLLYDLGWLLVAAGASIMAVAIEDTVDKSVVKEKYEYSKKIADEYGFTAKGKFEEETRIQAEYDKEKMGEVRYHPHD